MSKKDGVVYTPPEVVGKMLDMAGYVPEEMPGFLDMDFLDNSCGNGNILVVALERACDAVDKIALEEGMSIEEKYGYFNYWLTRHFHGMELNPDECVKCKERMNNVVANYLCQPVDWEWDIRCCDSLADSGKEKYDFVVCNPPYIRVHDLESDLSGYKFVEEGMKDMYLAFYELGLRQVKSDGVMCYITPSSWFTSTAGKKLRSHLYKNRLIEEIYDYGHRQVFDNATTYVEITVIKPQNARIGCDYVKYGSEELGEETLEIPYPMIELDGKFYFTGCGTTLMLNAVSLYGNGDIKVKNGYATLADDVFISKEKPCDSKYVIPVIKSSTGKQEWCIYPYDEDGKLVEGDYIISEHAPEAWDRLIANKGRLLDRSTEEPWYAFGRTQAINDTYKDKWAIKSIIKTLDDINPIKAPAGTGVYGGLYILCDDEKQLECLKTEMFMEYVKALKKYKSGGYYTFSSKDLEKFLNWAANLNWTNINIDKSNG